MTCHGDDFTAAGSTMDLEWPSKRFSSRFEVTAHVLGQERRQEDEIRVLNRVSRWEQHGVAYEPDHRHVDIVLRELELNRANPANSPGTREDMLAASAPPDVLGLKIDWESKPTGPNDAPKYRGVVARLNYSAQDKIDVQFLCKEASRRIARLCQDDWKLVRRI